MSAKRIVSIAALFAVLSGFSVAAQDSLSPAELPPAGFEGREYVDSRGCVFLRSTFGGEVTWVPRFGPDRQPICNGQTTTQAAAPASPEPATTAPATTAQAPAPAVRPVPQPVGQVRLPPAPTLGKEPPRRTARATAPRKPAAPRQARYRGPDADGRHPDCPLNAQYGRLVRVGGGKIMVMCVMSPELFPEQVLAQPGKPGLTEVPKEQTYASAPVGGHGSVLQVGSFGVPANAHRVQSRLQAQGIPVNLHRAGRLTVVTAGPFADGVQAHAALGAVRSMGIRDAFFR